MAVFNQIIKLAHIKRRVKQCLSDALKADSLRIHFSRLFDGGLYIQSSQYLLHAIPFAAKSEKNFNYWFDQVVDRACFDLFDSNGSISSSLKKELGIKSLVVALNAKYGAEQLKRELLYAYCSQVIGASLEAPEIAADQYLGFRQRWDLTLQTLLNDDFSVADKVTSFSELEWGRLCQVWCWMEVSAKNITSQSMYLCQTIEVLQQAIDHYFICERDTPVSQDKIVEVTEQIASHGVFLTDEAVCQLGSLIESFYKISRVGFDDHQCPQEVSDEIEAYDNKLGLPALMSYQYTTLTSLFYFSVNLNSISQAQKQDFLLRSQHEFHPTALTYTRSLKDGCFKSRFGVGSEDRQTQVLAAIDAYKTLMNDNSIDIFRQYQAAIETRQLLLYWLKDQAGISPDFYPYIADAMELLMQIEQRLNQLGQSFNNRRTARQLDEGQRLKASAYASVAQQSDLLTPFTLFSDNEVKAELPPKSSSVPCLSYILHGLYRFLCLMVDAVVAVYSMVVSCKAKFSSNKVELSVCASPVILTPTMLV